MVLFLVLVKLLPNGRETDHSTGQYYSINLMPATMPSHDASYWDVSWNLLLLCSFPISLGWTQPNIQWKHPADLLGKIEPSEHNEAEPHLITVMACVIYLDPIWKLAKEIISKNPFHSISFMMPSGEIKKFPIFQFTKHTSYWIAVFQPQSIDKYNATTLWTVFPNTKNETTLKSSKYFNKQHGEIFC